MEKVTFVIPSRNNLEFLQLAYKSIRNLKTKHEILILDDASYDGTQEWIKSLNDEDLITYHNPGPNRIGIVGMFDKGIEMSRTEIIFAFHADMVAGPHLDVNILKHLKPGTVVCATRIEPPLHPPGPEKITLDWGIEVEDYNYNDCEKYFLELEAIHRDKTTEGVFAPWCMYKKDFLDIGGHDELFAPQSKEDSDLFNRFVLNGYKVIQSWDGLVYHFTSRGSRFNKKAGGEAGKNSQEWIMTTTNNGRNFVRKWGHFVKHDPLMKPIIPPKYLVGFVINHCSLNLLHALEPWASKIYVENTDNVIDHYIDSEQKNTKIDLFSKIFHLDDERHVEILVFIDGSKFTNQDYQYIQQLSEILEYHSLTGAFELGSLRLEIKALTQYQNNLIVCKKSESSAKDLLAQQ
jgi:glycosyltransferase involved in cell wall biosynthesis